MISTHILDLNLGKPASGIEVSLELLIAADTWKNVATEKTNNDGRIAFANPADTGTYRLVFEIEKLSSFFTVAPVTFKITDTSRKYHIPLLLSPFGYSTYRGS